MSEPLLWNVGRGALATKAFAVAADRGVADAPVVDVGGGNGAGCGVARIADGLIEATCL